MHGAHSDTGPAVEPYAGPDKPVSTPRTPDQGGISMARKEAHGNVPYRSHWKRRVTLVLSALLVLGLSVALRHYSGPHNVRAQAPPVSWARPAPASSGTELPAPDRSQPGTSSRHQQADTAAVVNGQRITRQELADECLNRHGTEVLESLVNKHLIWQACQKQGITINSDDVEAEISRLAGKFGLSAGRWLTLLRDERGITPEQYRREIIWPTLALRSLAERQIEVTPQELQQAFESEYGPRVKARAITVSSQQRAEQLGPGRHEP